MRRLLLAVLTASLTTTALGQTVEWTPAGGLASGRVSLLKTNDVKPSVLWAGGTGGAFVSSDGGRSWTLKTSGLADPRQLGVPSKVMDVNRRNPDEAYVGIDTVLYRSLDGGNAWTPYLAVGDTVMFALDRAHPGFFFEDYWSYDTVCLYSSFFAGFTCQATFNGVFTVDPANADTIYAGGNLGLLKSIDAGKTWTPLTPPLTPTSARVDDAGTVWIGGSANLQVAAAKSTDGGITWVDASGGLPTNGAYDLPLMVVNDLAVSPANPLVVVAAVGPEWVDPPSMDHPASGFYRTIDGGAHWYRLGGHFEGLAVAFAGGNDETLVGGTLRNGVVTTDANPPAGPIAVDAITPTTGSTDGGTLVLISGSGFTPLSVVEIGGQPTTAFTFFDQGTICVRTTAHAAGNADVAVRNPDGGVAGLPSAFRYQTWGASSDCQANELCLEDERFHASVVWGIAAASAHPVAVTAKSGYFWFNFSPSAEIAFKVLDGRTLNGHYWIHWAALTDQPFTLTVFDSVTGKTNVYENPAGAVSALIDKTTF